MIEQQEWLSRQLETIAHRVTRIDAIQASLDALREQQALQTQTLARLSESVAKLAVIEERQATTSAQVTAMQTKNDESFKRAFEGLEAIEHRIDKLEQSEAQNERVRWLVWGAIGLILMGVLTAITKQIGL